MAYAATLSLLQILKQIQHSDRFSNVYYPDSHIQHLQDKGSFLKDFLGKTSSLEYCTEPKDDLENQIRDASYEALDIIESHISSHSRSSESAASSREDHYMSIFCQNLQRVIQDVDSIVERVNKFTYEVGLDLTLITLPAYRVSSSYDLIRDQEIMGRDVASHQLTDLLIGKSKTLQVVPIVGVPGIGKTILAELVYNSSPIERHFKVRARVEVSFEYRKRDILLGLLRSMKKLGATSNNLQQTDDQLAKYLYDSLKQKRYLVVLDDVRDIEAWNDLKQLFPDDNSGSRVMLTTTEVDVARFATNNGPLYEVPKLSEDESWALLRNIVYCDKSCPLELEGLVRDMARNCSGLPLVIVTLGGLLAEATITDWKRAASEISSYKNRDELTQVVVSLSYKSLPQHLKACLLYMGIFPCNHEIPVSKLIKLWIAEGFLEQMSLGLSLEEIAEDGLLQLVRRKLVSVGDRSFSIKIKTCRIHESFRDFFMEKAKEEIFFHVINRDTNDFLEETYNPRRLCILKNIRFGNKDVAKYNTKASVSQARSLLYHGPEYQYPLRVWLDFKLLRVLDALSIRFYRFPLQILNLLQLRYLAFSYNGVIPASVCQLRNLQFLILLQYLTTKNYGAPSHLPTEIWNLKELRCLQVNGRDLPDPSIAAGENDDGGDRLALLEYLVILSDVSFYSCTPKILRRIPNLKKLGVRIESPVQDAESFSFLGHLGILHRLVSLKCVVMHPDFGSEMGSPIPVLPYTLRKLSLSGCGFSWEYMSCIGSLPHLEVLKLRCYAFQGPIWETIDGQFQWLKFLLLEDLDIEMWNVPVCDHFLRLEHLIIRHCYKLEKIPYQIGEIPTLEKLEIDDCSQSLEYSAQQIQMEQLDMGNDKIQFLIHSSFD